MQKLSIYLIILTFFVLHTTYAQDTPVTPANKARTTATTPSKSPAQSPLNKGTIVSQFDYINSSSNNYQEYKVVKKSSLEKLKANVADTIRSMNSKLANVQTILDNHDAEVNTLKDSLSNAQLALKDAKEEKENFNVIGIQLSKTTYSTFMWSIVGLLLLALLFFIYRYKQSHMVTTEAKNSLEELRNEFEIHRKKAMEREQKLNRRLQDELNKRL
ncbi:hypothetical protein H8S90_00170 [Olivibacter sp. SDN3]|uniref:hypothetical protein n=1 Tax=Olivibacter sp. SDN3 TaxID=2764720 RepID=UPI0016515E7D|nr:hypothetical protein [Olivibacter sp. SDN3]QNL50097.1 hypothetical protein H8S90_00170 [Olivibacter sp. SDN3]